MATEKKCNGCRKTFELSEFMSRGREVTKCTICRQRINNSAKKNNSCEVCKITRACFGFSKDNVALRCAKCKTPDMIDVKHAKCVICKKTRPTFNYEGEAKATHCKKCKLEGMVDITHVYCVLCKKTRPSYNYENQTIPTHCASCKLPNMVNVTIEKCIICRKVIPVFNYEHEEKGTHCGTCKLPNMVDVVSFKCIVCKKVQPTFNYKEEAKATHCTKCKLPNMINIKDSKCIVCKETVPIFNYEDEIRPTHCGKCKLPNMIDIVNRKCVVCKNTQPTFNYKEETKATHCTKCKLPNMIDVVSSRCIVCKETRPCFNYQGESKATHCSKCKLSNMIDIKHPRCIVCKTTRPTFNYEGETKATHCNKCKLLNMVDIRHSKCSFENCKTRPTYGVPLIRPTRCTSHKEDGMIVNPTKRCSTCKKNPATHGVKIPLRCIDCKHNNEIDLTQRKCTQCERIETVDASGLCIDFCLKDLYFNTDYRKRSKAKETRVGKLLENNISFPLTSRDKIIPNTLNVRYRPDFVYELKTHCVFVEVDEFQHRVYKSKETCERMEILTQIIGKPAIWIRYNPDNYRIEGKLVKMPIAKREAELLSWVRYCLEWKNVESEEPMRIVHMYYDDTMIFLENVLC